MQWQKEAVDSLKDLLSLMQRSEDRVSLPDLEAKLEGQLLEVMELSRGEPLIDKLKLGIRKVIAEDIQS